MEGKQGPLLPPAKVPFFLHDQDVLESLKWDLMQDGEIESTYRVKKKKAPLDVLNPP